MSTFGLKSSGETVQKINIVILSEAKNLIFVLLFLSNNNKRGDPSDLRPQDDTKKENLQEF
jgi:hypothetical protein